MTIQEKSRLCYSKSKDEAFNAFKNWKTLVKIESGVKVKKLRTDNSREHVNV